MNEASLFWDPLEDKLLRLPPTPINGGRRSNPSYYPVYCPLLRVLPFCANALTGRERQATRPAIGEFLQAWNESPKPSNGSRRSLL